jgi:probable rRNA maturation factor
MVWQPGGRSPSGLFRALGPWRAWPGDPVAAGLLQCQRVVDMQTQPATRACRTAPADDSAGQDAAQAVPDRPSGQMHIALEDASGGLTPTSARWIRAALLRACEHLQCTGEVRVRVASDDEVAHVHQRYLGIPGTTDVITFDLAEGASASGTPLDVDVLVCLDEARRQATARGHAPDHELVLYALHGVLHCLGEDDHDPASHDRMHRREDSILQAIGVGATFHSPGDPGADERGAETEPRS